MKKLLILTIALVLGLTSTAYAAQSGPSEPSEAGMTQAQLNGYSEEQWASLMDNSLQYAEIPDLVHCFNPNMDFAWDSYNDRMRDMKQTANIMGQAKDELGESVSVMDAMIKANPMIAMNPEFMEGYAGAKMGYMSARAMQKTYNKIYNNRNKNSSTNAQLRQAEKQLTNGVRQVMIGYKTVEANVGTLETMVKLYQSSLKAYEAMEKQGMATETDVLNAQASLVSAQGNLANLKGTQQQLYNQLITMCGWKNGDIVAIGDIPEPDMSRADRINPETDITKAIGNNSTLISLRSGGHKKSSSGKELYDANEAKLEDNLRIELDRLYGNVKAARFGYEAAQAGYKSAQISEKAAKVQYEKGMLSDAQYIGASLSSESKKAALNSAKYALETALVAYEAALDGMCTIE